MIGSELHVMSCCENDFQNLLEPKSKFCHEMFMNAGYYLARMTTSSNYLEACCCSTCSCMRLMNAADSAANLQRSRIVGPYL